MDTKPGLLGYGLCLELDAATSAIFRGEGARQSEGHSRFCFFILFSNVLELLVDKKMGKNSLRGATDSVVVEDSDMC